MVPRLVRPAVAPGSLSRLPQPVLDLDDLILRPWRPGDAPAVAAAYADPGIRRWHSRSMTEDEARHWIGSWPGRWAQETGAGWAIARGDAVLGQISLRRLNLAEGLGAQHLGLRPALPAPDRTGALDGQPGVLSRRGAGRLPVGGHETAGGAARRRLA
jgi:hypothetical protein